MIKNYIKYAIVPILGYFTYYEFKSFFKFIKIYWLYRKNKKTTIKKITKIISNFNNPELLEKSKNNLINLKVFFDAELKNTVDYDNKIFKYNLINKNLFYNNRNSINLIDLNDDRFKLLHKYFHNNIKNDKYLLYKFIKNSYITSVNNNFNIFNWLKNVISGKINSKIEYINEEFSIWSNSKFFIFAEIIFNCKDLKLDNIKIIDIFKDKNSFKKEITKYILTKNTIILILISLIYILIKEEINILKIRFLDKIKKKFKTDIDELQCIICYNNMRCIVFSPCNHLMLCTICYELLDNNNKKKCMICKKNIKEVIGLELI